MKAINPATNQLIEDYPEHTPDQVKDIIELVDKEYHRWREVDYVKTRITTRVP